MNSNPAPSSIIGTVQGFVHLVLGGIQIAIDRTLA
jgi:hypothetical protein